MSCGTLVPAAAFSFSLTRLLRSLAPLSNGVQLTIASAYAGPQPQGACSLVWATPTSLAATMGIDFSFSSSGYLDVSVPRVPSDTLCIRVNVTGLQPAGFPHSDIKGSKPACGSPMLFAACHVLLRRLVPWHPPCALVRLITYPETSLHSFRSIDFPFCNWSSKTSFSSFFIVQLSRCAGDSSPFRISFQNPENDTDEWTTVYSWTFGLFALCPSFELSLCLFYIFRCNRPRFEASTFVSACSLERR